MGRYNQSEKGGKASGMKPYESLYKLSAIIEIEVRKLSHDKTEVLTRTAGLLAGS